jgi:hypothetical protein
MAFLILAKTPRRAFPTGSQRESVAGAALARLLRSVGGGLDIGTLEIDAENLVLSASRHPPPTVWPQGAVQC